MTDSTTATPVDQTLRRAAAGDGQAWSELVQAYTPRVFGLLVKQCGNRDLAEELTQATFVTVVVQLRKQQDGYEERGRFEAWLFRIAMNKLRDEMRRRKRQAAATGAGPTPQSGGENESPSVETHVKDDAIDPQDAVSQQEQLTMLQSAVEQLGEADREVIYLRHTAGLTFPQIAETLQQPLGTVLARGHRALGKLRKLLEEAGLGSD